MGAQLAFSTRSIGNGTIANSNRRFKRKVQTLTNQTKGEIARERLDKLFKPINYERIPSNNNC